jgi:hypothetical protein
MLPEVTVVLCQSNPPLLKQAGTPMRRSGQACLAECQLHLQARCRTLRNQAARRTQVDPAHACCEPQRLSEAKVKSVGI